MRELKRIGVRAFVWDFFGNIGMTLVAFIISLILTRILEPEQFGLLGMVLAFTAVAQVFMDMGFGSALVQKQNISSTSYSSVFWLNLFIGSLIFILLFFSSKIIANFYEESELERITKLISSVFIISSFGNVQRLIFTKKLDFKTQSVVSLIAAIVSGGVAIWMALNDFGVYALVYQKIVGTALTVGMFWYLSSWRPSFVFVKEDIKSIWGYSSREFLDRIVTTIYNKLDVLIIGKLFAPAILGFYTRAFSLNAMIGKFTSASLNKVFFPLISSINNDKKRVHAVYVRVITGVGFLSIGISGLFYLIAGDLFVLLFTEKWSDSVFYFQLLVLTSFMYPISSIMLSLINGLGFAGRVLKAGLYKKAIGLVPIAIGVLWGIEAFLYARIVFGVVGFYINVLYVKMTINITVIDQLRIIITPLLLGIFIVCFLQSVISTDSRILSFILDSFCFSIMFIGSVLLVDKKIKVLVKEELSRFKIWKK